MSTVFSEQPDAPDLPGELDLEERHALRRVAGLSTELQDISEVEYRALRLERVVLIGVWAEGSLASAENSLRELSRLAETAGSEVLDGLIRAGGHGAPGFHVRHVPIHPGPPEGCPARRATARSADKNYGAKAERPGRYDPAPALIK